MEALAARTDDGSVGVLAWNVHPRPVQGSAGSAALDRQVTLAVAGLRPGCGYRLTHERVDAAHSQIAAVWDRIRAPGQRWPSDEQWAVLAAADRLEALGPDRELTADQDGLVELRFELPMPAMSFVQLTPIIGADEH